MGHYTKKSIRKVYKENDKKKRNIFFPALTYRICAHYSIREDIFSKISNTSAFFSK